VLPPNVRGSLCDHGLTRRLLSLAVPRVELVDVKLPVEAQVVGVRAQEALDVRLGRESLEALLFEGTQVARPDLGRLLDLGELELLADASLAQAVADLKPGRGRL
jgi:hypothetical protein